MADAFGSLLDELLPAAAALCAEEARALVLTSDHGLSLEGGRLTHGTGGVFERAVARVWWTPGRA
jgi:hypothetical protein